MIAYGDSLTSGPNKWCRAEINCEPRGVPGERVGDGVDRYLTDLSSGLVGEHFVALCWGANDLRPGGWSISRILDPLQVAIDATLEAGKLPVLWVPHPQYDPPMTTDYLSLVVMPRLDEIAPQIRQLGQDLTLPVIDTYDALWTQPDMESLYADHVHLTAEGYDLIAEVAVPEFDWHNALAIGVVILVVLLRNELESTLAESNRSRRSLRRRREGRLERVRPERSAPSD